MIVEIVREWFKTDDLFLEFIDELDIVLNPSDLAAIKSIELDITDGELIFRGGKDE